jgi:hypothetical protein
LIAYSTTKHSMQMMATTGSKYKRDPDAMDVDALGKGKKGKGGGASSGCFTCGGAHYARECPKTERKDNMQCWVCFGYGHMGKDCYKNKDKGGKGKGGKEKGKGKGGKKGDKGKGKGKNKKGKGFSSLEDEWPEGDWADEDSWSNSQWLGTDWLSAVDGSATQTTEATRASTTLASLDLNSLDRHICGMDELNTLSHYTETWNGVRWLRVNYDSGAVTTAIPLEVVEPSGFKAQKQGEFIVASGDTIPDYGRVQLQVEDEQGYLRGIKASVTEVHKPLGSAAEFAKSHDSFLWEDGGALVPKSHPIAIGMRKEWERLSHQHGLDKVMTLHRQGSLYNFYVQMPKEVKQISTVDGGAKEINALKSGNSRQAKWP